MLTSFVMGFIGNVVAFWVASKLLRGFRVKSGSTLLELGFIQTILNTVTGTILAILCVIAGYGIAAIECVLPCVGAALWRVAGALVLPLALTAVVLIPAIHIKLMANIDGDFELSGWAPAFATALFWIFIQVLIA